MPGLIVDQLATVPPVLTADLKDKTVLVTGANTGIGLEAAKHFARMGPARVILACRSKERGQKAAELIVKETNFKAEVELLDLAVIFAEYVSTKDGWEQLLHVNHLSTALLCFFLVPSLLKAVDIHTLTQGW
ncbi:hypothetical protein BC835DRAFT_1413775 [Cytidiella melzeri]|nr:hypothetical protein BC835DRAFT_1413775 [Cytidiella melzeri]